VPKKTADAEARTAKVSPDDLYLDAQNPRIDVPRNASQFDILKYLSTNSALEPAASERTGDLALRQ
jgi:hypothetical protein